MGKGIMRRRGFTLVEMLIVVAILAVLMSITFRLVGAGGEDQVRTRTIVKMQKIENCLSGYYAAFGSYPPVKVHGSRDINCPVDENGDQVSTGGGGSANQKQDGEALVWARVEAACRSQPFGCEYPGTQEDREIIEDWSQELKDRVSNSEEYPAYAKSTWKDIYSKGFTGPDPNDFSSAKYWDSTDWTVVKLFKFGVMSYLLPRFLFMLPSNEESSGDTRVGQFYGLSGNACAQWDENNDLPCDPFEGRAFDDWKDIVDKIHSENTDSSAYRRDLVNVANIPSQAVCARWMPNLEQTCRCIRQMEFFGVKVGNENDQEVGLGLDDEYPPDPITHDSPNGSPYKNTFVTINDGWGHEFYYYSPAPFQTYTVWSAGPNGKTFPPWMSLDDLSAEEIKTAMEWKNDDIIQMSH